MSEKPNRAELANKVSAKPNPEAELKKDPIVVRREVFSTRHRDPLDFITVKDSKKWKLFAMNREFALDPELEYVTWDELDESVQNMINVNPVGNSNAVEYGKNTILCKMPMERYKQSLIQAVEDSQAKKSKVIIEDSIPEHLLENGSKIEAPVILDGEF